MSEERREAKGKGKRGKDPQPPAHVSAGEESAS